MKKYIGTKIVKATPMSFEEASLAGYRTGKGAEGGYEVTYEDGYKSWSPKTVFEEAYSTADFLSFGDALQAMKFGYKVARHEWTKNNYLNIPYRQSGFIYKTKNNTIREYPWLALPSELIAEDWYIIDEPNSKKTHK